MALESILSIDTGDSIIRSGVLDAERTISSKEVWFSTRPTATFWLFSVICILFVLNPKTETSMVNGGVSETFNTNFPSKSVVVPTAFLEILMFAPGSVSPDFASFTVPVIVVCANIAALPKTTKANSKIFFVIILIIS